MSYFNNLNLFLLNFFHIFGMNKNDLKLNLSARVCYIISRSRKAHHIKCFGKKKKIKIANASKYQL